MYNRDDQQLQRLIINVQTSFYRLVFTAANGQIIGMLQRIQGHDGLNRLQALRSAHGLPS